MKLQTYTFFVDVMHERKKCGNFHECATSHTLIFQDPEPDEEDEEEKKKKKKEGAAAKDAAKDAKKKEDKK